MINEDVPSLLGPMDEDGLWFFMATKLADEADPAARRRRSDSPRHRPA